MPIEEVKEERTLVDDHFNIFKEIGEKSIGEMKDIVSRYKRMLNNQLRLEMQMKIKSFQQKDSQTLSHEGILRKAADDWELHPISIEGKNLCSTISEYLDNTKSLEIWHHEDKKLLLELVLKVLEEYNALEEEFENYLEANKTLVQEIREKVMQIKQIPSKEERKESYARLYNSATTEIEKDLIAKLQLEADA